MLSSGLPELSGVQDLKYVQDALQPQTTDAEATIFFTRYWIGENWNISQYHPLNGRFLLGKNILGMVTNVSKQVEQLHLQS